MSCQDVRGILDAYFDGELDLVHSVEIENHLSTCTECRELQMRNDRVRRVMQSPGVYMNAPSDLRERIRASLPSPERAEVRGGYDRRWLPAFGLVAGLAAAVLVVVGVGIVGAGRQKAANEMVATEVLSSHIRSLMPGHLTDVLSTDQHTVKPWFAGKLDFAPTVKNLSEQGFPLTGGRLDYIDGRAVAALTYSRRKHTINLFLWPGGKSDSSPRPMSMKGYNLIRWNKNGMAYWAVSDLDARELTQFVNEQRK